ncbi:DUF4172 domain-containing protein [Aeromonas veronii]
MEPFWIWQQADWPHFRWRDSEILPRLRQVQRRQGILIGSHSRLVHIPADHEHRFRFNVNTISGPM